MPRAAAGEAWAQIHGLVSKVPQARLFLPRDRNSPGRSQGKGETGSFSRRFWDPNPARGGGTRPQTHSGQTGEDPPLNASELTQLACPQEPPRSAVTPGHMGKPAPFPRPVSAALRSLA